jgi:hypothetical protein
VTGQFETLIYTDCPPGQGLGGTGGLQFQARSPQADEGAMSLVRQHLLYEPPDFWMRQRRPVADYPPSLSHVYSRRYIATAAGVYLGREANGGREGNQLTHSIITRSAESYGLVRPAQLFQAAFWINRPTPGTECPPLAPGWRPGPFDVARAQEMVRRHPDGDQLLLALLSALHGCLGPGGKRVLFVATDGADVLHWLAAATFLMPQRFAVRIGFKVFTTDPATATQPVLAVHPDWSGPAAEIDNDRGYIVFNLVERVWTPVELTQTARRWVGLFRAEDPYDVMDAVEVAYAVEPKDAEVGWPVALAAVLRRGPTNEYNAHVIVSWLRRGSAEMVGAYGPAVTDLLLRSAGDWSTRLVGELAEAASQRGLADQAPVRLALLAMMIQQAEEQIALPDGALHPPSPHDWRPVDEATAVSMVNEALRSAEPRRFEALLRVAALFQVPVSIVNVASAARKFITDWADHPGRPYQPDRWVGRDELLDLLRDELDHRLVAGQTASSVGDDWSGLLLRYPLSVERPIGAAVIAARMHRLRPKDRPGFVDRWAREALAGKDRERLLASTVAALWTVSPPEPAEVKALLTVLPRGIRLRSDALPNYTDRLLANPEQAPSLLEAAHELVNSRAFEPDQELLGLLAHDSAVQAMCAQIGHYRGPLPGPVVALRDIPTRLFHVRREGILDAMLSVRHPPVVLAALYERPNLAGIYYARLVPLVRTGRVEHVVAAFYLVNAQGEGPLPSAPVREALNKGVRDWLRRVPNERIVDAADSLIREVGEPWHSTWRTLRESERRRPGIARFLPFGKGRR